MPPLMLPERIKVGAFFLETLTTGMYEDPFHCLREYVQNSFDAIIDAINSKVLGEGEGKVTISVTGSDNRQTLMIRDNGTGIRTADAVDRLVSLGSSTKKPGLHAGFRGIGRLAGIAYCSTLQFKTKSVGESIATIVSFDCSKLRGFMAPGAEARDIDQVIRQSVSITTVEEREIDHFTEVQMIGLSGLGLEFTASEKLTSYLSQYTPVDYASTFDFADRVRAYAAEFGSPLPVIDVELKIKREKIAILKPYKKVYPTSGEKKTVLTDIHLLGSKENGWFGWFGMSNFAGEIPDETVAGMRFRMKNIQIGNESIIEAIAARLTAKGTERRLQRWAVGEIFITSPEVIPNARRDGFEDNQAWELIKNDIEKVARTVVKTIRSASTNRNKLKSVTTVVDETRARIDENSSSLPRTTAREIDQELKSQLDKIDRAVRLGASPQDAAELVASIKEMRERLEDIQIVEEAPKENSPEGLAAASKKGWPALFFEALQEVLTETVESKSAKNILQKFHARLLEKGWDENIDPPL